MEDNQALQMLEGFKAYAPSLAYDNDGFSAKSFEYLYESENQSFWFRSRNEVIRILAKRFLPQKAENFLEIGCGTGYVLSGLKKAFPEINFMGSEIHINGLHYAKKRNPDIEFIQLDARSMPFESSLDAIGAFDVIEHITEDSLVLENCYKALKPGGQLFITVPQYQFMWSYLDDQAMHKRRYSKKELVDKVRAAGFEINYCGGFVFALFPLMLLSRVWKGNQAPSNNVPVDELNPGKGINKVLRNIMRIDEWFIRQGITLPWGGSLVLVGRKITR